MAPAASPLDISSPPRFNSQSPRNHTSTLTSALQEAGSTGAQSAILPETRSGNDGRLSIGGKDSSIALGSSWYSGARPISVKDRNRRESNTGSYLNGGMSWGGISVGSFIRDDLIMGGTSPSPYNMQSPSYHSSSYLPKMEANLLRDYTCCGINLDSLHELLTHFEDCHAQQPNQTAQRHSQSGQGGLGSSSRPTPAANGASTMQDFSRQPVDTSRSQNGRSALHQQQQPRTMESFNRTQLSTVQDLDSLDDMEMDDADSMFPMQQQDPPQPFRQSTSGLPQLNLNTGNNMQFSQGMRTSTPTTPSVQQGFPLHNNPTVSSVNTPTLSTQPLQQSQSRTTPHTSMPGTPAELDPNFNGDYMSGLGMNMGGMMQGNTNDWGNMGYGIANELGDLTIDDPAKRLFSKQAAGLSQQQLQFAIRNGQLGDVDPAKQRQLLASMGNIAGVGYPEPENKPFKCPVIGCEKAYKNQNGLKYHKVHGHTNQKLKANEDGTFSIVDPLTSVPYPGTIGMEKEKPYRCEVCGKRYKNLNGLKYHRQHSPHCNPELKLGLGGVGIPTNLQGMGVNVAGAGLGLNDPSMF